MPIAIRHSITYEYLIPRDGWVYTRQSAAAFMDSSEAEAFCAEHHLTDVHLVLFFEEGPGLLLRIESAED